MIKLENAGLRAPRKMSLDSGVQSPKRIRAQVSKMIGLRAPQQKFQGSKAPGTPPPPLWDPDYFCSENLAGKISAIYLKIPILSLLYNRLLIQ